MSDWPKKMWMYGKQDGKDILVATDRQPDPTDDVIHVLVYPANQAPEPVGWLWQHDETGRTMVLMKGELSEVVPGWFAVGPLYLAPPSESAIRRHVGAGDGNTHIAEYLTPALESAIRASERERCAKLAEQHFITGHTVAGPHFAAKLAAAIRELSDE